ncbi:hypothetical protein CSE16_18785 [Solibacillus sp. R5-41]|nr:hypothetical protein CSE16_18785 [Solibacillus sp. R5-41]
MPKYNLNSVGFKPRLNRGNQAKLEEQRLKPSRPVTTPECPTSCWPKAPGGYHKFLGVFRTSSKKIWTQLRRGVIACKKPTIPANAGIMGF